MRRAPRAGDVLELTLHLDLNAELHHSFGRQTEERRRPNGITRHQYKQFLPPDRHALTARDDDRLATEEVRRFVEIDV